MQRKQSSSQSLVFSTFLFLVFNISRTGNISSWLWGQPVIVRNILFTDMCSMCCTFCIQFRTRQLIFCIFSTLWQKHIQLFLVRLDNHSSMKVYTCFYSKYWPFCHPLGIFCVFWLTYILHCFPLRRYIFLSYSWHYGFAAVYYMNQWFTDIHINDHL